MLIKFSFYKMDKKTLALNGGDPSKASWQRTAIKNQLPMNPGQTFSGITDYCSVFVGPFSNHPVSATRMPSLNGSYYGFTLMYIILGCAINPNHPGIAFIIISGILGMINLALRCKHGCDTIIDSVAGLVIGSIIGSAFFALVYFGSQHENGGKGAGKYVIFGKSDNNNKQCGLSKTKFKCTYT